VRRVLLADIGGTYARFAVAEGRLIGSIRSTEVGSKPSAVEAIRAFLKASGIGHPIDGALLAVAGPVEGGRCKLTNAAWTIDEEEIARIFSFGWARLVNDLEAVAAGLPDLNPAQTRLIGNGTAIPGAPMAIIAPGTGLGMACLVSSPAGRSVITSEGGHASLASPNPRFDTVIDVLRRRFGHVSAERVLSGPGLVNLHQALSELDGFEHPRLTPVEVTEGAFEGSSPTCRTTVDAFCALLGSFAGDVALTYGARGGLYIGGGIVPRFVDYLERSMFRQHYLNKGRLAPYLERIPVRVILHPTPAFTGLMNLADALASRFAANAAG
jgi:glucokinase